MFAGCMVALGLLPTRQATDQRQNAGLWKADKCRQQALHLGEVPAQHVTGAWEGRGPLPMKVSSAGNFVRLVSYRIASFGCQSLNEVYNQVLACSPRLSLQAASMGLKASCTLSPGQRLHETRVGVSRVNYVAPAERVALAPAASRSPIDSCADLMPCV